MIALKARIMELVDVTVSRFRDCGKRRQQCEDSVDLALHLDAEAVALYLKCKAQLEGRESPIVLCDLALLGRMFVQFIDKNGPPS